MRFLLLIITILAISTVDGQQCSARFNQLVNGQCSSIHTCHGTVLTSDLCENECCCVSTQPLSSSQTCITANDFDVLYNTSRARFLRTFLNYGIQSAGICHNCQAKAAFLAVAAAMTQNFQADEATGSDAQFTADDNKYGNSQRGDGSRFRQRGFFGLRGRTMYSRLQTSLPQYQSLNNPESVSLIENAIVIALQLWKNPNLLNESALTQYADGSFYGFSMLWYKVTGDIKQLSNATQYYSTFLRQLKCGGDLYHGQGPICQYNTTHQGTCAADCIKGWEDSSMFCGCSGPKGPQCPNSPKHIRCCLETCSQELKMDLGIVLDASGSIGLDNYKLQLQFTKDLLRRVNIGSNKTHVGIINYSDVPQTLTWLNSDYTLIEKLQRIDQAIYYAKTTDTSLALGQADTIFSNQYGRRQAKEGVTPVIFVITDGESKNPTATIQAANVLKRKDIILISVGVGNATNLNELHAICSSPVSENYFAISNYNALQQKLNQFTSRTCSEPVTILPNTTVTTEITKDKYKFLKVKIVLFGNKIRITVTLSNGKVKIFHSFKNRNPKDSADFIDYELRTNDVDLSLWRQVKSFFQRSLKETNTMKTSDVMLVIEKPDNNTDFAYISIKGVEEHNQFEVKFEDCAKVNCIKSNASIMHLSIIMMILCSLFML